MVSDLTSNVQCVLTGSELTSYITLCSDSETFDPSGTSIGHTIAACPKLYIHNPAIDTSISNKDISDRFLTALILSLIVCLANIGLALFGFLLFRTPGDF